MAERSQSFLLRNKLAVDREASSADDGADEMSPEELAEILGTGQTMRRKKNSWLVIPRFMNGRADDEITAGIKQRVVGRKEQAVARKRGGAAARQIGLMVQCVSGRFPTIVASKLVYSSPRGTDHRDDDNEESKETAPTATRKVLAPSRPVTGGRRREPLPLFAPRADPAAPSLADLFRINQEARTTPRAATRPLSGSASSLYTRKLSRSSHSL